MAIIESICVVKSEFIAFKTFEYHCVIVTRMHRFSHTCAIEVATFFAACCIQMQATKQC